MLLYFGSIGTSPLIQRNKLINNQTTDKEDFVTKVSTGNIETSYVTHDTKDSAIKPCKSLIEDDLKQLYISGVIQSIKPYMQKMKATKIRSYF